MRCWPTVHASVIASSVALTTLSACGNCGAYTSAAPHRSASTTSRTPLSSRSALSRSFASSCWLSTSGRLTAITVRFHHSAVLDGGFLAPPEHTVALGGANGVNRLGQHRRRDATFARRFFGDI